MGCLRGEPGQLVDLLAGAEGEVLQVVHDIRVGRVEPELMEGVGTGQLRVQPNGAALALAELGAVAMVTKGVVRAWTSRPSTLWIRSTPASRLPHWSLPPYSRETP